MPNSGCTQKGQAAGSETRLPSASRSFGSMPLPAFGDIGSLWSGGCGSGRLICTKHSEQID